MHGRAITIHETLITIAKSNHPNYVHMFEQRKYGPILRTAAFHSDLDLVELMLKVKDQVGLDINGQSSNGNTALDWAFESNAVDRKAMGNVVDRLMKAGAKVQEDLVEGVKSYVSEVHDSDSEEVDDNAVSGCRPF